MNSRSATDNSVFRVVLASFIGTTIEWYDFFLYGTAAALVFPELFFPSFDALAGTMAAYGTYAVGFFARPIGGVVFGHFGDRIGRKSMLVTTLMMMGIATFLIGILPTYDQIGIAAPIALTAFRFVQGFGVGGEWGGAVLMAVEHGHRGRRGLYASWVQAGVPAGLLLATATFTAFSSGMSSEAFLQWGWRVPFLLGIVLLAVGMFIRIKVFESPLFAASRAAGPSERVPILGVLRRHPGNVVLAMGARFAENASFYIFSVFVLTYATMELSLDKSIILRGVLTASLVQFFVIPILGGLSDRVGRRPVYLAGAISLAIFAYPFFWLIDTKSEGLIQIAIVVGFLIHAMMYAPQAAFFSELFGTRVRYSGASIGYQLASPLAGGLAPIIATGLLHWNGGRPGPIAIYLIGMSAITILSVWLAAETHRAPLDDG